MIQQVIQLIPARCGGNRANVITPTNCKDELCLWSQVEMGRIKKKYSLSEMNHEKQKSERLQKKRKKEKEFEEAQGKWRETVKSLLMDLWTRGLSNFLTLIFFFFNHFYAFLWTLRASRMYSSGEIFLKGVILAKVTAFQAQWWLWTKRNAGL